ncbi:MAG: hypothetical protein ACO1NO_10135 [Burkholderiaceae bacterium]
MSFAKVFLLNYQFYKSILGTYSAPVNHHITGADMKTKAFALILASLAVLLLALTFSQASGKSETANRIPANSASHAERQPVQHVGMGENQPLQ